MRLIVFDLDHTLITANSSFRFGAFLYKHHFFSSWTLLRCLIDYSRYKWLGMSIHDLHFKTFDRLFKGRFLPDIQRSATQFLDASLDAMLYAPAIERLKQAQAREDAILILSSSPDFLVGEIAKRLGVQHWQATTYLNEKDQLIAISQVMEGEDKAHYLQKVIDRLFVSRENIMVYSDSHLDLPILKMAGHAVGVKPDSRLREVCLKNGWDIL